MSNFADQVKQAVSSPSYKMDNTEQFNQNVVKKVQQVPPEPGAPGIPVDLPMGGQPTPEAPKAPAKVKIGGQEFASIEEATIFAEKMLAKAEGKEEALKSLNQKPAEEAPPEKTFFDEIEEEIFVNPKAAIEKLYKKAKEDTEKSVFDKYDSMTKKQKEEAQREAQWTKTMDDFYSENKDLSGFKDAVDYVMERNWSKVADLPVKDALKVVSDEARKLLKLQKEASLPKKELSSEPPHTLSSTLSEPGGTPEATKKNALDFITQLNKMRKRTKE